MEIATDELVADARDHLQSTLVEHFGGNQIQRLFAVGPIARGPLLAARTAISAIAAVGIPARWRVLRVADRRLAPNAHIAALRIAASSAFGTGVARSTAGSSRSSGGATGATAASCANTACASRRSCVLAMRRAARRAAWVVACCAGVCGVVVIVLLGVQETPVDQWIVHKGLEHRHQRVLVLATDTHHVFTRVAVDALDAAHFHRLDKHACETERDLFWELVAMHCDFKAVAEIDVHNLAACAVHHEIGRVAIAKTENVADHRHHTERAGVVCALVEPHLAVARLEPEHLVQILARCVIEGVLKDLDFLHQSELVKVRGHHEHQPVLNVEHNCTRAAVLLDQGVQRVRVGHPSNETRVGRERNHGIAANREIAAVCCVVLRKQ
eukprot:comp20527_c0_seq1/m.41541 comp20527_c0_seq1/g.41541  ORF comp20527_c0_seq1/g.41541 comp20527_c0_seq1/m.41541 type:complete len:384 (+) comp20527_c0_seq1:194-1345(+)